MASKILSQEHVRGVYRFISPPPHVHVGFQGEQQVGEQPLVHGGPLEFWDTEHSGAWAGAELPALLLRHGHPPEAQVDAQVPLQLRGGAAVKGLQWGGGGGRWGQPEDVSQKHLLLR